MTDLTKLRSLVTLPDPGAEVEVRRRLDQLTKPPGSLGRLEELVVRLAAIAGTCPPPLPRPVIFTLAGDHGVVAQGVSAYPQVVTAQMVENFLARRRRGQRARAPRGRARRRRGPRAWRPRSPRHPALATCKIAPGTADMARGPAMTRAQAVRRSRPASGSSRPSGRRARICVGTGEMGIGNTTAASAMVAALTGATGGERHRPRHGRGRRRAGAARSRRSGAPSR